MEIFKNKFLIHQKKRQEPKTTSLHHISLNDDEKNSLNSTRCDAELETECTSISTTKMNECRLSGDKPSFISNNDTFLEYKG